MPSGRRVQQVVARLQAAAQPPLPAGLVPLVIGDDQVGLMQPEVARHLRGAGLVSEHVGGALRLPESGCVDALARIACSLRDAGLITGWRDELLPVRAGGRTVGAIERAACRPLGIATEAVHLNAYRSDDTVVVAQRARHKQIDPGLWDNLVGGMVPAGETRDDALAREAWEEAGLRPSDLEVERGRSFLVRRPVPEGLQIERIHVHDTTLPAGVEPRNQDGEVAAIEARDIDSVLLAIERHEFTLESALVMVESLTRRAGIPTPEGLYSAGSD